MTRRDDPQPAPDSAQPLAGLLAWVLPGAGHFYLGHTRRGLYVGAGVLGLFTFGLLTAGISAVDSGLYYHNLVKRLLTGAPPAGSTTSGGTRPLDKVLDGDAIWFAGDLFVGPLALAIDYVHQYHFKVIEPGSAPNQSLIRRAPKPHEGRDPATGEARPLNPGEEPPYRRAIGRVQEIGTLACTLAGMLNLIAIIDASWNHRRRRGEAARSSALPSALPGASALPPAPANPPSGTASGPAPSGGAA